MSEAMMDTLLPDRPPPDAATRERREWWAITDSHTIVRVVGWSCETSATEASAGYWWVPVLGYSMRQGVHLFKSRGEAIRRALSDLEKTRRETDRRIKALRAMAEHERRRA